MNAELSQEAKAYLTELAADIAEHGGLGDDPQAAIHAAHARRQAFAMEMAKGQTERARMVREAFATAIWLGVQSKRETYRLLYRCDAMRRGEEP